MYSPYKQLQAPHPLLANMQRGSLLSLSNDRGEERLIGSLLLNYITAVLYSF
jgi:hypothetical protein